LTTGKRIQKNKFFNSICKTIPTDKKIVIGNPETVQSSAKTVQSSAETVQSSAKTALSSAETVLSSAKTVLSSAETILSSAETVQSSAETVQSSAETVLSSAKTQNFVFSQWASLFRVIHFILNLYGILYVIFMMELKLKYTLMEVWTNHILIQLIRLTDNLFILAVWFFEIFKRCT